MTSRHILVAMAALTCLPATVALTGPAQAQRGGYDSDTYVDRDGYAYRQDPRGATYRRNFHGGAGRSSGVGVGSDACDDPSYRMDPRCYTNR
ncbi:MAG: hypothetical protein JWM36_4496 [Hyphomicrobiales bacterium]|nr:hypothetical protein [Hyphomicrobiales bacterium]